MKKTNTYKLASFESGDFLNATEDRRRFATLDYHLGVYVGILGNGIISGWHIERVSDTTIMITNGSGFISGFYSESGYENNSETGEPIRKSVAESLGYVIAEEIPGWASPSGSWSGSFFDEGGSPDEDALIFNELGPEGEDKNYDGLTDGVLAPSYKAPSDEYFSDPYVKSFSPSSTHILLNNNVDTYIFAERINSDDPNETFVKFVASSTCLISSNRVLLGKVTTRNESISKIDESLSFRLAENSGAISKLGKELVMSHVHGGSKISDPPRIKLKTDIRRCTPYNKVNGETTYTIVPSAKTGITNYHRHEFYLDASGNGYTTSVIGAYEFHYHKIVDFEMSETIINHGSLNVTDHTHTVPQEDSSISNDSTYKVYVNGKEVKKGDYSIDASSKKIKFKSGKVNMDYPVYSCSFDIRGNADSPTVPRTYFYELETPSIERFIIGMMKDFYSKYQVEIEDGVGFEIEKTNVSIREWDNAFARYKTEEIEETKASVGAYYLRSPFSFLYLDDNKTVERDDSGRMHAQDYVPISESLSQSNIVSSTGGDFVGVEGGGRLEINYGANSYGLNDVKPMSIMAESILKKKGDEFTLLPNVAKFITMKLDREGYSDEVIVEILDDVEVEGILKQDNIYFVKAEKFISGKFKQSRIPFLDHIGRIGEEFVARRSGTSTKNGIEFALIAHHTDMSMGHSHRAYIDGNGNGVTIATLINNKIAVFAKTSDNKNVRITHSHAIINNKTENTVSEGINLWSNTQTAASHSHAMDEIVHGSAKSIFAVAEDADGNLIMSTSDGLWVKPMTKAFLTTVGDLSYYSYGLSVEATLRNAISRYSNDTGQRFILSESLLSQTSIAETSLLSSGNSYSFGLIESSDMQSSGVSYSGKSIVVTNPVASDLNQSVYISIAVKQYAKIDNLYIESTKPESEINSDEIKIRIVDQPSVSKTEDKEKETYFLVRKYFTDRSFWNIKTDEKYIYLISYQGVLRGSSVSRWTESRTPNSAGLVRNIALAGFAPWSLNGDSSSSLDGSHIGHRNWIMASNSFIAISRNNGVSFSAIQSSFGIDFFDISSIDENLFVGSANDGIYLIDINGYYSKTLNVGDCRWISVDYSGVLKISCITTSGDIYVSNDGSIWTKNFKTSLNTNFGKIFALFGKIFIATDKGLVDVEKQYENILPDVIRCSTWSNNKGVVYLAGDGCVYQTTDGLVFSKVITFTGNPFPAFYANGVKQFFNYAHNYEGGVCFVSPIDSNVDVSASMSFDIWDASKGPWDSNSKREIFINNVKILSNKTNIDKRGIICDNFIEHPQSGTIDFSTIAQLSASAKKGTKLIYVNTPISFHSSKSIIVSSTNSKEFIVASSIINGVITLETGISKTFAVGDAVRILSNMSDGFLVTGNFFTSDLSNIGTNTHQETEDTLSVESIGLPMRLGETYLGNLSALAASSKKAIPEIDSKLINWKTYGMDYDCNPSDPNYFGIDFDIEATLAASKSIFGKESGQSTSKIIRCIEFGYGDFNGLVFAGTDAGLFYSSITEGMIQPWIKADLCPVTDVFGIVIVNGDSLVVGGLGGICISKDGGIIDWDTHSNGNSLFLGFRWTGNVGSYWWNSWNGSINTISSDLTNIIISGDRNLILVSEDNGLTWGSVNIPIAGGKYNASAFVSATDGTALMGTNGDSAGKTSLIYDLGAANDWREAATFYGIRGTISSCVSEASGNVMVSISYGTNPVPNFKNHSMTGLVANVDKKQRLVADNRDGKIYLQGTDLIKVGKSISISPISINSIIETKEHNILVGTNLGVLTDNGTYINPEKGGGIINRLNKSATVNSIDISGEIVGVKSLIKNSTSLVCSLSKKVLANELVGRTVSLTSSLSPAISILSPTPNVNVASTNVTISTSTLSFEPGVSGYIKITIDSASAIYSSSNTKTLSNVPIGQHVLSATLVDRNKQEYENSSASQTISFTTSLSSSVPTIAVTFPVSGQTLGVNGFDVVGNVYNFNANGVDGTLTYALDAGSSTTVVMRNNGEFVISLTGLSNGNHSIRLALFDNKQTATGTYIDLPFVVKLTNDPYIVITYPTSNSVLAVDYVTIQYEISNFSVPNDGFIRAQIDGVPVATSRNQTELVLSNLRDGTHNITLGLVDLGGVLINSRYGVSTISLNVKSSEAASPRIVALSPTNGYVFGEGVQFVSINYDTANFSIPSDGGVVIKHGASETFVTENSPYNFPISGNGQYSVSLTLAKSASNKLQNSEASTIVDFVVGTSDKVRSTPQTYAQSTTSRDINESSSSSIEQSTSSEDKAIGFVIVSNGTSSANGETIIVVSSSLQNEVLGKGFRIQGKTSTVYISPSYPIVAGEFAGGTMYIDPSESNNGGKTYHIVSNTTSSVTLNQTINAYYAESEKKASDVYEGQSIKLVGDNNFDLAWATFDRLQEKNSLVGESVLVEHVGGGRSYGTVVSNTSRTLTIYGIDRAATLSGDTFRIMTPVFSNVQSFSLVKTSTNLDHYHEVTMVTEWIYGDIDSISYLSSSQIWIQPVVAFGINDPLISLDPTILRGAKIVFYSQDGSEAYDETIDLVYSTGVIINISSPTNWNLNNTKPYGIDSTYKWEANVQGFGKTNRTIYTDLIVYSVRLEKNAIVGAVNVWVPKPSLFVVGDLVELFDSKGSIQQTSIVSVSNSITIKEPVFKNFSTSNGASIRIRRDVFDGDHEHAIKHGEIYSTQVDKFKLAGYTWSHNHILTSLIKEVNCIKTDPSGYVYVGGSSKYVYSSHDGNTTWQKSINLEDQGGYGCESATCIATDPEGRYAVGTGCGFIMVQAATTNKTPISNNIPIIDDSSSSSSESSSSSSSSSLSSYSSSSTQILTSSSFSSTSSSSSSIIRFAGISNWAINDNFIVGMDVKNSYLPNYSSSLSSVNSSFSSPSSCSSSSTSSRSSTSSSRSSYSSKSSSSLSSLSSLSSSRSSFSSQSDEPLPEGQTRRAVVVSIEDYPGTGTDLIGLFNNLTNTIAGHLNTKFGFEISSRLIDSQATIANVESAFVAATSDLVAGDAFVFFYGGHGSRNYDAVGGDEEDHFDENRALYNGAWSDDRIRTLIDAIPEGVKVTIIFDSCFGGTGTRTPNENQTRVNTRTIPEESMRELLLSASEEGGLSYLLGAGGFFSQSLARHLKKCGRAITARQLYSRIEPEITYGNQHPVLEGPEALKDSRVFV